MKHVAVIGGGMAGVTCALTLADAGAEVTLFEAAPQLGGRWATHEDFTLEHEGREYRFPTEHGLHGIWRQYHNLRRLLETHGLSGSFSPAGDQSLLFSGPGAVIRSASIGARVRESALPHAVAQWALLSDVSLRHELNAGGRRGLMRAGLDLSHAAAFRAELDIGSPTSPDYDTLPVTALIARWPPLLRLMFSALTHSAFFRAPEEVSLLAWLAGLEFYALGDKRNSAFEVSRLGPEASVFGPLARILRERGARIERATPVAAVDWEGRRIRAIRLADGTVRPFDAVAVAVDAPAFARIEGLSRISVPGGSDGLGVPSVVLRLLFPRLSGTRPDRAASGVTTAGTFDTYFWLDRLQDAFARWSCATGGAALECHLYGARALDAATRSDDELTDRVSSALNAAFPELGGPPVGRHIRRNAATHTAFPPGSFSTLPRVDGVAPNLALCGDWIHAAGCTLYLERATLTGLLAARALAPALSIDPAAMPEPLQVQRPRGTALASQRLFRALRKAGLLPSWRIGERGV